jgi:hypothetical protein
VRRDAPAWIGGPFVRYRYRLTHKEIQTSARRVKSGGVPLGVAGGHEFFTDDPKKFSDLILFVLGGIPNTTGVHVLDGGVSLGTKNQRTGFVTINGQPAFVNFTNKP